MKQEIAMEWAAALESGEYSQTIGTLHDSNGFCCLGVLCDIHKKHNPDMDWQHGRYMDTLDDLPSGVMDWAGIRDSEGTFMIEEGVRTKVNGARSLVALNDGDKSPVMEIPQHSFAEIAAVVRENYEKL